MCASSCISKTTVASIEPESKEQVSSQNCPKSNGAPGRTGNCVVSTARYLVPSRNSTYTLPIPCPFQVPSKTRESGTPLKLKNPELLLLLREIASETERVLSPMSPVIPGPKKRVTATIERMNKRGIIHPNCTGLSDFALRYTRCTRTYA